MVSQQLGAWGSAALHCSSALQEEQVWPGLKYHQQGGAWQGTAASATWHPFASGAHADTVNMTPLGQTC